MAEDIFDDSKFGAETELKAQTMEFGVPGDYIIGTFIKARHGIETQYGVNSIYEFLAEKGSFHRLEKKKPVDTPTIINKGEQWSLWGRNDLFNGQLNSLRVGQIVKIFFEEEVETKMGQAKIIKIRAPRDNTGAPLMNQIWLEEQSLSGIDL